MSSKSKRMKSFQGKINREKVYSLDEAVAILKECPPVKFDQSVEIAIRMGIDPKKSDQQVRSTVSLPHGTGKDIRVLVFCKGEKAQEAKDSGADFTGDAELIEKVKGGWTDFDAVVTTPDMMREVGKLGKVLGPRGLMPTPKAGTVTTDIAKAVKELKAGKIEFKLDRQGVINNGVAKLSFAKEQIVENIKALIAAIQKVKPAAAKGVYMKSLVISSTMGPGIKVDLREAEA